MTVAEPGGWQRLDARMLLVHPVRELVRFLPVLLGLFLAGTASGDVDAAWHIGAVGVPVTLGLLRYLTTYFRIADGRVELRRGLVNRHVLSAPLDRVRTVDITASPVHRLLGLTTVRVGTGTASTDDDEEVDLDGLPLAQARRLRSELLARAPQAGAVAGKVAAAGPEVVLRLDPSWVRFAPLTSSGLVIAAGLAGIFSQLVNSVGVPGALDPSGVADSAGGWSVWVAVPLGLLALVAVVSALSVAGYLLTYWGFTLTRAGTAWHVRRGLLTTRETTLDDERVRGLSLAEPLGLRLARAARVTAIVTGLDRRQRGSSTLVPPAPRPVAVRVAREMLGSGAPMEAALADHGRRARLRRFTRALAPAAVVVLVAAVIAVRTPAPSWLVALAALALPVAAGLAADRARALGHTLVARHVVARSGSLTRRREALEVDGIIGWNFRSTWFQRRAGLTSLVATTAGGRQAVTVLDVPEPTATSLAHAASPDLLGQFLV